MRKEDVYTCTICQSNRIPYIDFVKGVAIFLMVLCHAGLQNSFTQWIYSFHMPLFFIVSGFLVGNSYKPIISYIRRKSKQLLIPYFLFALILCFGHDSYFDWVGIVYGSRNSLNASFSFTPLWFLPCFYLSTIINNVINFVTKKWIKLVILVTIGSFGLIMSVNYPISLGYPFSLNISFVGVALMFLGKVGGKLFIDKPLCGGGMLIIGTILSFLNLPQSLTFDNPHIEMSVGAFGNPLLFLIVSTSITVGLLSISKRLIKFNSNIRLINPMLWIGENSISVLCIHGFFIAIVSKLFFVMNVPLTHTVVVLAITIISLLLCYPATKVILSYMPNLLGKDR